MLFITKWFIWLKTVTKIRVTLKALTRLVMFWLINLHVAPENKNKRTIIRKQN